MYARFLWCACFIFTHLLACLFVAASLFPGLSCWWAPTPLVTWPRLSSWRCMSEPLRALCPCVTLFLSLIVSLALRVVDSGQVSRNAFPELQLLRLLLGGNWLLCVAGALRPMAFWGFL